MIKLLNQNNLPAVKESFDLIYADMIYENTELSWMYYWWKNLKPNSIFIVQTDWHTLKNVWTMFDFLPGSNFINHLVWKNEWGNFPKRKFHQVHDDILVFSNGENYKFYPDRIQVPKATAKTNLNPSGRQTKTATSWIDNICLTTTSNERVKLPSGKLIRWQKPVKLFDLIVKPFTDECDLVGDIFMGSGSLGVWSKLNKRNYIGIEFDTEVFNLAQERLNKTADFIGE